MKFSKAWCGLFTSVGAGIGLTAYLANKGSAFCQNAATTVVNSILDAKLNLSGLNTTIRIQSFPYPLQIALGDLSFNLRHALTNDLVDTLEDLPQKFHSGCNSFIWEQGALILLTCAGLAGFSIYFCKRLQAAEEQRQGLNERDPPTESDDLAYQTAFNLNRRNSR
jgi:hypothetical protein